MSDIAISVDNISKRYQIGVAPRPNALRDLIASSLSSLGPGRRAARPRADGFVWALRDVSFDVRRGEVLGLIGRNGAGKSTLLKLLSRITRPTLGRAALYGRVGSLLEIGAGFHSELTGRENIFLNGAILGMKKAEISRAFTDIVDFAEVHQFIDTPVKHYSSGMYLRLAFAVAAHLDPEILIIDEILAVGDTAFQKRCLAKIRDVAREGRTILLVSHQLPVIQSLASRAVLLVEGKVSRVGPTSEVITAYLSSIGENHRLEHLAVAGTRQGRFGKFSVLSRGVASPPTITQGDPLTLSFTVVLDTPLAEAGLALALRNADGVEVFSHAWMDEHPTMSLSCGEHRFTVDVPTDQLRPGPYSLTLCLTHHYADTVALISGIDLPPITLRPGADLILESRRWGVVEIPCRWRRD